MIHAETAGIKDAHLALTIPRITQSFFVKGRRSELVDWLIEL
jgi:hypothetical protein